MTAAQRFRLVVVLGLLNLILAAAACALVGSWNDLPHLADRPPAALGTVARVVQGSPASPRFSTAGSTSGRGATSVGEADRGTDLASGDRSTI